MTKRKLSISLEDLNEILDELQSIMNKVKKIIPKVEDTISIAIQDLVPIGNLMQKEEILDNKAQIYEDVFESD
jgi:hypothetical protein